MANNDLLQRLREQRLTTLTLADQIKEDRWREPALPGGRTIHDVLSHILAWDEWGIAVFEISAIRPLPPVLTQALEDVDAFNARAVKRFHNITRDDILSALQSANGRLIASAQQSGGAEWGERRIPDLAQRRTEVDATQDATQQEPPRGPSVRSIVRNLANHEQSHAQELMDTFGITPQLEKHQQAEQGA